MTPRRIIRSFLPVQLIVLLLALGTSCQADMATIPVSITGVGETIRTLQVWVWRDHRLSNEGPQDIDATKLDLTIRVPISESSNKVELVVLGVEGDGRLRSHGYAAADVKTATSGSPVEIRLAEAQSAKPEEEFACPNPTGTDAADCDSPIIHTADVGVYWQLRSRTLDRTLSDHRWYVWSDAIKAGPRLRTLDSLGANYAVVAGDGGAVIECIGNQCTPLPTRLTQSLRSVRVRDERISRIVGEAGVILRCEYGSCSEQQSGTKENLNGLMVAGTDILRAVGDHGTLVRCDDTGCGSSKVSSDVTLRAIWGSNPSSYWIVGNGGLVLRCRDQDSGQSCTQVKTPTTNNLTDVWGSDLDTVFVVGDKGTILVCSESGCAAVPNVGTTSDLRSIQGSGPDNIIVTGAGKTTIQGSGGTWRPVERKPTPSPRLAALTVSVGSLSPAFSAQTEAYTLTVPTGTTSVRVTASVTDPSATIQINDKSIASGSASPLLAVGFGVTMISVAVQAPGTAARVYAIAVMRSSSSYLKASNTEAEDWFGGSVSLSGDTLAVGARLENSRSTGVNGNQADNGARWSGAVYVFVRTGTTWTQQAYLKASNTGMGDQFGYRVSLSGDTLAVGAPGEGSNATGVNGNQTDDSAGMSGAVYVFIRIGSTWTQQAYLKASNTGMGDQFGASISLSGDTLAVGAFDEDSSATGVNGNQADNSAGMSGAVYVFIRTGVTWTQQAYLKASNTEVDDNFGHSVSLSGNTLAVGANNESSSATGIDGNQADNSAGMSGAVYVFVRTSTTWTQQAYLKASNAEVGDRFGASVSLSGDSLAVGAYGEASGTAGPNGNQADNNAPQSGAVYVFVRTGTIWTQQAYLKASNAEVGDWFGASVSLSGDTLAIGAPGEDGSGTGPIGNQADNSAFNSGSVYLFVRTGTIWTQQAYLKASNTGVGDSFGFSVALSGDGLASGAFGEESNATGVNGNQADNSAKRSGAVFVF